VIYASCIPRFFPAAERARAIAVLLASLQISGVIGAPLAGWLTTVSFAGLQGWQALFLIEAVPAVVFGVIVAFWMADSPREARWLTDEERQHLTRQYEESARRRPPSGASAFSRRSDDREVLKLCLTYFLWITGFWGFSYWTPTVLKELSGWSNVAIGRVIAGAMLVSLVASLWTGPLVLEAEREALARRLHMFLAAVGMRGAPSRGIRGSSAAS
jgi:MFS family permease